MYSLGLLALSALPVVLAASNETILGVYMFHRHGDRTAKAWPPANLTALGYQEVYTSGEYYRSRYVASDADFKIATLNSDLVKESQIAVSAPDDVVLQNSAAGFLQGLYPPVGAASVQTLRNGTNITAPMDGFQLIPVELVSSGTSSEDSTWLQAATGCAAATLSSNNYFSSEQYVTLLNSTKDFYASIDGVVNGTYNSSVTTFKNAYVIYDLINVAEIHNQTINDSSVLTTDNLFQLRTLADTHEWGLAYNATDDLRAVAGMVLAGQILTFLNTTITGKGATSMGIQFGAYGTFASFFGLANLTEASPVFYGIADYASAMTFELFTNTTTTITKTNYPSEDDIYVRFLWHNGTTSNISEPVVYPMFGTNQDSMKFADFATSMEKIAISSTEQWCIACGNTTGTCAEYATTSSSNSSSSSSSGSSTSSKSKSGNGLSPAVNGVIGAIVAIAVILALEALILLATGRKIVSKKNLGGTGSPVSSTNGAATKA